MEIDSHEPARPVFSARIAPKAEIMIGPFSSPPSSIRLELRLQKYPERLHTMADTDNPAALVLDMRWEDMVSLHDKIRRYAEEKGLPLPG